MIKKMSLIVVMVMFLASCASMDQQQQNEAQGTAMGATAGAAQFVEQVQRFHVTGEKPDTTRNFRFPTHNHSTKLAADILVDVSKVQLVLREPLNN